MKHFFCEYIQFYVEHITAVYAMIFKQLKIWSPARGGLGLWQTVCLRLLFGNFGRPPCESVLEADEGGPSAVRFRFFSWASVEYLIKTVYNWWGVCEWETLFRSGFSYNIEFNNQFQHNIFAVCWIQIKEIDESTIQRPRIWPAFLAFILFPPIGFISFLLYKNTIDHIKYRRHGSSTWMDANIGPDDHIW